MAHDRLIPGYLRELRLSVACLRDADDIVAEAEDHLWETVDRLVAQGRTPHEAEAEALARFGSAALVAKVCLSESTRGAAVPTTGTRLAGFALLLAPFLALFGQWGNLTTDNTGGAHGTAVVVLGLAFPALIFGLWGLQARHGGLGRIGIPLLVLALLAPLAHLSYYTFLLFPLLVVLAVLWFGVQMLRASVLPVAPVALMISGPILAIGITVVAIGMTITGGDGGDLPGALLLTPLAVTGVGLAWLGWHLSQETAVDRARPRPVATT